MAIVHLEAADKVIACLRAHDVRIGADGELEHLRLDLALSLCVHYDQRLALLKLRRALGSPDQQEGE